MTGPRNADTVVSVVAEALAREYGYSWGDGMLWTERDECMANARAVVKALVDHCARNALESFFSGSPIDIALVETNSKEHQRGG